MSIASRTASPNLSWRLIMRGESSGEQVAGQFRTRGERARPRKGQRALDLIGDRGLERGSGGLVDHTIALEHFAMERDRAARNPGIELLLAAVSERDIAKRPAVLEPSVGEELDERRPAARADIGDGGGSRSVHDFDFLAIVAAGLDAV